MKICPCGLKCTESWDTYHVYVRIADLISIFGAGTSRVMVETLHWADRQTGILLVPCLKECCTHTHTQARANIKCQEIMWLLKFL